MSFNIIDDEYEHENSNLEYVLENILSLEINHEDIDSIQLQQLYNSKLTNTCKCSTSCNDVLKCAHGGNYVLDNLSKPPELVLNDTRKSDLIYECSFECLCTQSRNCLNRLVQFGPRKHLEIIESNIYQSKGLRTTADIPKGAFICEYAGEILTLNEAKKRTAENERLGKMNYILCLNEIQQGSAASEQQQCLKTIIDPSCKGNIGRYLNHSCNANCEIFSVRVDCPVPKICIFSKRFIYSGEELCFHYGGGSEQNEKFNENFQGVPCLCKADNCAKFLPNASL